MPMCGEHKNKTRFLTVNKCQYTTCLSPPSACKQRSVRVSRANCRLCTARTYRVWSRRKPPAATPRLGLCVLMSDRFRSVIDEWDGRVPATACTLAYTARC